MTTQDIITRFELYVDDNTELSTSEELELAQKIYNDVCGSNAWEILKKPATGTTSTTVPYVALPADFAYIVENNQYTDNSMEYQGNSGAKVVFVGTSNTPYKVINWSDRRQYRDADGYCYVDIANSRLYFCKQPTSAQSYEFDYISVPAALTLSTFMVFPERFASVLFHGMCVDDYMIQQSDKLRSYAKENQAKYDAKLEEMKLWNSNLLNN